MWLKIWSWSSYRATAGLSVKPRWLSVDWLLARFAARRAGSRELYQQFVSDGKGQPAPWQQLREPNLSGQRFFCYEDAN